MSSKQMSFWPSLVSIWVRPSSCCDPRQDGRIRRMWDQQALIDQVLANDDKLDEDLRAELPLKRIWTVAVAEDRNLEE